MTSTEAHPSVTLARALVAALVDVGVRDAVLCPGSRDAPLLYAFADLEESARVRLHVRLDERSAGFMALGLGKASFLAGHPRPAAVVCTSGTAVANLHPAALEADAAGIPLLIITANRPEQLWHTGANQTTAQPGIFGAAMRFQTHIPSSFPPDSHLRGLTQRLVAAALGTFSHDPGPVHLDISFDDPLVPDFGGSNAGHTDLAPMITLHNVKGLSQAVNAQVDQDSEGKNNSEAPSLTFGKMDEAQVAPQAFQSLRDSSSKHHAEASVFNADRTRWSTPDSPTVFSVSRRTTTQLVCPVRSVVVAGDSAGADAEEFARTGGWPLLAEPSSGSRFGPNALTHYQQILTSTDLAKQVEHVVVFGHPTLSRSVSRLLHGPKPEVTVVGTTPRWTDVAGTAHVVPAPVQAHLVTDPVTDLKAAEHPRHPSAEQPDETDHSGTDKSAVNPTQLPHHTWLELWQQADQAIDSTDSDEDIASSNVTNLARAKDALCAKLWEASCPEDGKRNVPALVIGASDVIRSFDRFAVPRAQAPIVASNRGLAGIDGTVSTALGLQAGLGRPVRVVLGDLATLHDLTGFLHGSLEAEPDLQVVVLNDHGGAIFAGLEHAQAPRETLERFFLTPQDAGFRALAHATGWKYAPVDLRGPELDPAAEQTAFSAAELAKKNADNAHDRVTEPVPAQASDHATQVLNSANSSDHQPVLVAAEVASGTVSDQSGGTLPAQPPASTPTSTPDGSVDISNPQPTGLDLLTDLLSHPIHGRSMIEVRLPAV